VGNSLPTIGSGFEIGGQLFAHPTRTKGKENKLKDLFKILQAA